MSKKRERGREGNEERKGKGERRREVRKEGGRERENEWLFFSCLVIRESQLSPTAFWLFRRVFLCGKTLRSSFCAPLNHAHQTRAPGAS